MTRQFALWERKRPLLRSEQQRAQIHPDPDVERSLGQMRPFHQLINPRFELGEDLIGLRDLNSSGCLYEITPLASEASDPDYLLSTQDAITASLTDLIPERSFDPWIVGVYVYDEPHLGQVLEEITAYADKHAPSDEYTSHWLTQVEAHLRDIASEGGMFRGDGEEPWRARRRHHRLCVWRRRQPGEQTNPTDNLDYVCQRIETVYAQAGIHLCRLSGADLSEWLTVWFAPASEPSSTTSPLSQQLLHRNRWNPNLASADIARSALNGAAPTTDSSGLWWFHGRPSRFITVDELTREPEVGHLTAERQLGNTRSVLLDTMPPGTIWSMVVVFEQQDAVADHIRKIRHNAVGADPSTLQISALAAEALTSMASRHPIYPVFCGVYTSAPDTAELDRRTAQILATLSANGLAPIAPQHDPIAQDSYIRALPFCYDPVQDRRWYAQRARLWHAEHIARAMPFMGRSAGTSHPGVVAFNRGGEPLAFDPLNPSDRRKNAHSLVLGPTGSGKTSLLIYMLLHILAARRPRLYLITALPTFGMLADYCESHGLEVARRSIDDTGTVQLPPFAQAATLSETADTRKNSTDDDEASPRDLLGEMEIMARLMITGGVPSEEKRLRRDDLELLRSAILHAGDQTSPGCQTMTGDVVASLRQTAAGDMTGAKSSHRRAAAERMASAMNLFCTGADGEIFNRPGRSWPDVDVTVVELGYYARKGYEDRLAVAVTGLMSAIQNRVEAEQYSDRQTIVVVDEAHVLLQNPLVSPYLARIVSTWRTFGAWLWIATQNLRQFPEEAKQLLDQPEWWILLGIDKDEIDQISRFRDLSPEEKSMILSAQPAQGRYTEGTVVSGKLLNLFRNIPPPIALALAQTEKHEKAARARICKERGVTELEAAEHIADQIRKSRLGL